MDKLTQPMQWIIRNYSAGAVATVNADGSPAVSPKATFVVVDEHCIAYGDIRSPGTRDNLLTQPSVEVCFTDVLARLAVRVSGQAEVVARDSEQGRALLPLFERHWALYVDVMGNFIRIRISAAELITSPAYDAGFNREQLVQTNIDKLNAIARESS